jgi:hypothetical protein
MTQYHIHAEDFKHMLFESFWNKLPRINYMPKNPPPAQYPTFEPNNVELI